MKTNITNLVKGDEISFFYAGNGEWVNARVEDFRRDTLVVWNLDKNGYRSYTISKMQNVAKLSLVGIDND
ncbi:MAG: hypothetical protein AAB456_02420 [Patescibacteria group bacterium]